MPINLLVIPQVIPHPHYLEHLHGAFDSSEDTVRAFASLSLARLHPDVTTWKAAAEALNMPGPMGVRLVRACSATMLVSPDEARRRDYRATEAKIEHRLYMSRWFNEWARQFRPGTHYSSVGYGLTWQWVNVAHAHLDLSPAWRGKKPTAKDRAHYRQFADSLDEDQQFELAYALHKRA